MKTSRLLLLPAMLCFAWGANASAENLKPLETWGIKTADYKKAAEYWSVDYRDDYNDVPPPNCEKAAKPRDMKILCSREDFQKLAWFTRRFYIYNEENARKIPIDHKKEYAWVYHSKCTNEDCLGRELKKNFYDSAQGTGAEIGDDN